MIYLYKVFANFSELHNSHVLDVNACDITLVLSHQYMILSELKKAARMSISRKLLELHEVLSCQDINHFLHTAHKYKIVTLMSNCCCFHSEN